MKEMRRKFLAFLFIVSISIVLVAQETNFEISEQGYFSTPFARVLVCHNNYPEGRRGGVEMVLHGKRILTNGEMRLTPLEFENVPGHLVTRNDYGERLVDRENNTISNKLSLEGTGISYQVELKTSGDKINVSLALDQPLPDTLVGKAGFYFELYPYDYTGKSYFMDGKQGIVPLQAAGPVLGTIEHPEPVPLAVGKELSIAPGDSLRNLVISTDQNKIHFYDGRDASNHKWLVVYIPIQDNKSGEVIRFTLRPGQNKQWIAPPVICHSQVGYHPGQSKIANIELDPRVGQYDTARLIQILPDGNREIVKEGIPNAWGNFMSRHYVQFDFTSITKPGIYQLCYGKECTEIFPISRDALDGKTWQTTLETFIPVQMCHVEVDDKIRRWHGACHLDDGIQAPAGLDFYDGYSQSNEITSGFEAFRHIPYQNLGGWHDAGDNDPTTSSNISSVHTLCLAYEEFKIDHDQTSIDRERRKVEIHFPDGKPDVLQQIEHGVLHVLGGYRASGHCFPGIVSNDWMQYLTHGDLSSQTDNGLYDASLPVDSVNSLYAGVKDDRYVFTTRYIMMEYQAAEALAASGRVLEAYNQELAKECLETAIYIWNNDDTDEGEINHHRYTSRYLEGQKINTAIELYLSTNEQKYLDYIVANKEKIAHNFYWTGWKVARIAREIEDASFRKEFDQLLKENIARYREMSGVNPFGMTRVLKSFGNGFHYMAHTKWLYYYHQYNPELVTASEVVKPLEYVWGNHPVSNHSLVTGVGSKSVTKAFGFNRADFSYIPGGVVSGPAFIKPDFFEFRYNDPFFWIQKEYTIASGCVYLFCVNAANKVLNVK